MSIAVFYVRCAEAWRAPVRATEFRIRMVGCPSMFCRMYPSSLPLEQKVNMKRLSHSDKCSRRSESVISRKQSTTIWLMQILELALLSHHNLQLSRCISLAQQAHSLASSVLAMVDRQAIHVYKLRLLHTVSKWNTYYCARFEVSTAVTMKNGIFWNVTPCSSSKNKRFGGT
jgi:hypothetical protein